MKFKIIGNPISHSLSPTIHNYWFKKYNIKAEYSSLEVNEEELANVIDNIRNNIIKGINITLPYKQKIIPFLNEIVNEAKETNSVNTVYLNNKNEIIGENTDVYGVQAAYLKEVVGENIKNQSALIIGAGGVAPSIVLALLKSKISKISITNRTHERSLFIQKRFPNLEVIKWSDIAKLSINFDVIINATSLGLKNGKDFDFEIKHYKKSMKFIDTIYNPLETTMIKYFKNNGVKTYNGLEMLLYQAQKSFYLWTKINPEIDNTLVELLVKKLKC
jgi:shikimate dehydrogenase